MKSYEFTLKLVGHGDDPASAWRDARRAELLGHIDIENTVWRQVDGGEGSAVVYSYMVYEPLMESPIISHPYGDEGEMLAALTGYLKKFQEEFQQDVRGEEDFANIDVFLLKVNPSDGLITECDVWGARSFLESREREDPL